MIFTLFIFNKQGVCLYHQQWNKEVQNRSQDEQKALEHEKKNIFGLLFSMKNFVNSLTPYRLDTSENEPFYSFTTKEYKLHYFETLSGLRFVLTTDKSVPRITDHLRALYRHYVEDVVKNPLYQPEVPVDCPAFQTHIDQTIRQLPFFSTPIPISE